MKFWIQVHGIPVDYISKETTIRIENMLGVVAEVENSKVDRVLRRSFLRIRVGINITKALPTEFCSRQGGWKEQDVKETARGQQSMRRGSEDRQDTEESMIRDDQNLQHELREDDFLENQFWKRTREKEQRGRNNTCPTKQTGWKGANIEGPTNWVRKELTRREIKSQDQKEHHGAEASYEALPKITEHEVLIRNNQTNGSNRESYRSNKEKLSENREESKKEKYKQEYKAESGDMYYVELASDDEEGAGKTVENNRATSGWEIELANCMQQSLKLKRKREDRRILQIAGVACEKDNKKDPV
ncbi:hypothetical protein Ahy_B08g093057 [Arachis hypogaea]|uniref:Uncharacterized protein n=1 Tax=Arachis hypogaea TaxID=3818 RepID=A0A444Y576_ARAHY|nr:hypothetical protein Ahy_B08g093057 [Arachis hypogaea]